MSSQISTLISQKIREESAIQSLHAKNAEYQFSYDHCLTTISRLEQQLNDLLFYKKKILEEFQHLKELTVGDASPMGRIHFHRPGLLEGKFLERAQLKLLEQKRKQKQVLDTMEDNMQKMKGKEREIEDQIEMERMKLQRLEDLMASNRANIDRRRMEIAMLESKIRAAT